MPETLENGFRDISLTAYLANIAQDMGGALEDLANRETDVLDATFGHEGMYYHINDWRQSILEVVQQLLDARNSGTEERDIYNAIQPLEKEE